MIGINARVVKADRRCLDGAVIQLQGAEVQRDTRVRCCVFDRVQARDVACFVKDEVALDHAIQNEALDTPATAWVASSGTENDTRTRT